MSQELPRWNKGPDGKPAKGPTNRRAEELALAKTKGDDYPYPCNDPDNDGDPGDPDEGSE